MPFLDNLSTLFARFRVRRIWELKADDLRHFQLSSRDSLDVLEETKVVAEKPFNSLREIRRERPEGRAGH